MTNTIRTYRNTVKVEFKERGDSFSLKVPHYNKWISSLNFLRKRGFTVTENDTYKQHYDPLSKFHKIGFKKDVACLMEISADKIEFQFGHIKNLWKGMVQSFWDNKNDERYATLTYLQEKSVEIEIKRFLDYCLKWGELDMSNLKKLTAEEEIIEDNKRNTHIHGEVNSLEDIKKSITLHSSDYHYNSNDKNKKKIICGETKYFYDWRTKRLSCGQVWHNINNMWWVISGQNRHNVAAFDLFDFDPSLPKKQPVSQGKINSLLRKYEAEKNYLKCHQINKNSPFKTKSNENSSVIKGV